MTVCGPDAHLGFESQEHEYLEASKEAVIADGHPELTRLKDRPKDQDEELIKFNLVEEGKETQPIYKYQFVC